MGHAARQKQGARARGEQTRAGNPATAHGSVRFIPKDRFDDALKTHPVGLRAVFSDRAYVMDASGQMRRLPPSAPRPPVVTYEEHQASE